MHLRAQDDKRPNHLDTGRWTLGCGLAVSSVLRHRPDGARQSLRDHGRRMAGLSLSSTDTNPGCSIWDRPCTGTHPGGALHGPLAVPCSAGRRRVVYACAGGSKRPCALCSWKAWGQAWRGTWGQGTQGLAPPPWLKRAPCIPSMPHTSHWCLMFCWLLNGFFL